MPYGVAKSAGGDSPSNDAKMERCVSRLQKVHGKVSAIKICKSSIQKKAHSESKKEGHRKIASEMSS